MNLSRQSSALILAQFPAAGKNLLVLFLFFSFFLFSQDKLILPDSVFFYYKDLNEKESGLPEFKDDDTALRLKLAQLEVINESRKKHKAQPVKLDILASRVANKMCREATENNFTGHFNLAGEKPYHRYASAGGKDHIVENASSKWSSEKFPRTNEFMLQSMKFLHGTFMAEKAPHDGHKKNCIDPHHNFVGLGLYWSAHRISYFEEFIDRYLEYTEVPVSVKMNEDFFISLTVPGGQFPVLAIAYCEKFPQPMPAKKIDRIDHYDDFGGKVAARHEPWEIYKMKSGPGYRIPFRFNKPGLYYINIYLDKSEIRAERTYNSDKWIQACGIVVRVE